MQTVFKEIIAGDADAVGRRITKDSRTVALIATPPPKKHAGHSLLQVAYLHGQFEIAALLLEHGADPNFIDRDSWHPWAMPVLHDAIRAAVMSSRWLLPTGPRGESWKLGRTAEQADAAYAALVLLLESGANVGALDSYGNSSLARATFDARQVLPAFRYDDPEWVDPKPLNPELASDLSRIFSALMSYGADPDSAARRSGGCGIEISRAEPVAQFLHGSSGGAT